MLGLRSAVASDAILLLGAVGIVLIVAGLLDGASAVAGVYARRVAPSTSRPALLLACRQMATMPSAVVRPGRFLTLGVLVAGGAAGMRSATLASLGQDDDPGGFFVESYRLVGILVSVSVLVAVVAMLVGVLEIVVARRRTLAATRAIGAPAHSAGLAVLLSVVLPIAPVVVVAAIAGAVLGSGFIAAAGETPLAIPWGMALVYGVGVVVLSCLVLAPSLVVAARAGRVTELRTAA